MCLLPEASRLKHIVQTQPFRCWSCVLPRLHQDTPQFRVKSRVLDEDGWQVAFRIKGSLVAPSEKETGHFRSQLSSRPSLLLQKPLWSAPPESCSKHSPGEGPSPPPAGAAGFSGPRNASLWWAGVSSEAPAPQGARGHGV